MFEKWFPKKMSSIKNSGAISSNLTGTIQGAQATVTAIVPGGVPTTSGTITFNPNYSIGSGAAGVAGYSSILSNNYVYSGATASMPKPRFSIEGSNSDNIVLMYDAKGIEIVRICNDGMVIWKNGIDIGAAEEALMSAFSLSIEKKASVKEGIKHRIRDSVFQSLIEIAEEKGSLTAADLTYLLEASKIMEKLRGE